MAVICACDPCPSCKTRRFVPSPTKTFSPTATASFSPTATATATATATVTATATAASTATATATATATPSATPTSIPVPVAKLYATDLCTNVVTAYALTSTGDALPYSATTGLAGPEGLAIDSSGAIYVLNYCNGTISSYPAGSNGSAAPIATIGGSNTRLTQATSLTVDRAGDIYVGVISPASPSGEIAIFAAGSNGNVAPSTVISGSNTGLSGPFFLALDSHANIYASEIVSASISVFAGGGNGNVAPSAVISGSNTGLGGQEGLALDSADQIYSANLAEVQSIFGFVGGNIAVYGAGASGDVFPAAVISTDLVTQLFQPFGIAQDPSRQIYVANSEINNTNSANALMIYAAGSYADAAPAGIINGTNTQLSGPRALALDSKGNIYAANEGSNTISVYPPGSVGNSAPSAVISGTSTGICVPTGIAFDSTDNIYVSNQNNCGVGPSVTEYPAGSNGGVRPSATIAGSSTGLSSPGAIALDSSGNIYVANYASAGSIVIFAAGTNGNIAPTAAISGSNTELIFPDSLIIDKNGDIYVGNDVGNDFPTPISQPAITIFSAGSTGNVAPLATIGGPNTQLFRPQGLTLGF